MSPIPVYILAGGRSSRFGQDKALVEIGGRPMIAQVREQWSQWTSPAVAVADRKGKYDASGLATIADTTPGLGPLGGLLTALKHCGEGWLLLAACDSFVLDTELRQRLFSEISDDVMVVALKGKQWETMPALYHCSILPVVCESIARNELSLWRIIEKVPHKAIEYSAGQMPMAQINTQEDRQKYHARMLP